MILKSMQFATNYLITNAIGMFWRNMMNRGIQSINLLLFMGYVSHILSVDNTNNIFFPGSGSVIGTESESRFVRSLI